MSNITKEEVKKFKNPEAIKKLSKQFGVVIGTKEEAAWKLIRDSAQTELEQSRRSIIIGEAIIKLAEEMMKKCT